MVTDTDYDTWKKANGVTGTETDDDDSDGLTNHEEYAFGLDPTGGSSVNPITSQLNKANGKFSYTRRATPATTGLTYTVWTSTDLATWTEDTGATRHKPSPAPPDEVETVEATITGTLPLTQSQTLHPSPRQLKSFPETKNQHHNKTQTRYKHETENHTPSPPSRRSPSPVPHPRLRPSATHTVNTITDSWSTSLQHCRLRRHTLPSRRFHHFGSGDITTWSQQP